jgi:PIN domain nuclease of toxin-antitoxin system
MSDRALLDTHVLLWAVAEPHRLNEATRLLVTTGQYSVSVASLWELMNKREKKDAPLKDPVAWWNDYVVRPHTRVLSIRVPHVLYLERLPWHHRDPYDRILIAQAAVERMPLVTSDAQIRQYAVEQKRASAET